MKGISVIEDSEIVKKILKHLGLWDQKARPPPKANSPPMTPEYHIDYTDSQLPVSDSYLYVDPQYPETYTAWFLKNRWVQGIALPESPRFSPLPAWSSPDSLSWHLHPSQPRLKRDSQFQAASYPHNPAGGKVDFGLTHKAESPIVCPQKRGFLSHVR